MRSEVSDGVYTGRPDGPFTYREGKAQAIRRWPSARASTSTESFAYSDSESDLPMLRAVGHPVAVNPDAGCERVAREEGWQVMRFDKLARRLRIAGSLRRRSRWPRRPPGYARATTCESRHKADVRRQVLVPHDQARTARRSRPTSSASRSRSRTRGCAAEAVWIDYGDRRVPVERQRPAGSCRCSSTTATRCTTRWTSSPSSTSATPTPPLYPARPVARRAEMDVFIEWFNRVWKRAAERDRGGVTKPQPDRARSRSCACRCASSRTCSRRCSTAATT